MLTKSSVEGKWQLETSAIYRHVTWDQKTKKKKKKHHKSVIFEHGGGGVFGDFLPGNNELSHLCHSPPTPTHAALLSLSVRGGNARPRTRYQN